MIMGEVVNTLKVMPESPEVDLEALKAAITDAMPENYTKLLKNLLHSV